MPNELVAPSLTAYRSVSHHFRIFERGQSPQECRHLRKYFYVLSVEAPGSHSLASVCVCVGIVNTIYSISHRSPKIPCGPGTCLKGSETFFFLPGVFFLFFNFPLSLTLISTRVHFSAFAIKRLHTPHLHV